MAEENDTTETLFESSDGEAGVRYHPDGGEAMDGVELAEGTLELYSPRKIKFTNTNHDENGDQ